MINNINNNDITESRNAKDTKVAVFMNSYGKKKIANECKKELYTYCKINNYKIVSTFSYKKKVSITELYDEITKKAKKYNFQKVIVFDFREICLNALKLISLTEMLKDFGIEIEIVDCDYLLDKILSENIFLETWFEGDNQQDFASFYDEEDYFNFLDELEYQREIDVIRLNKNRKIERKTVYSEDDLVRYEEWQEW